MTKVDKYSTIIWDWNGTLLDDVSLCIDIVNEFLPNHNSLALNKDTYKEVFDFPIAEYYKKIGIDFNIESFESLTKKFIGNYDSNVKKQSLHENTIDILVKNKQLNKKQFILTAGHKKSVTQLLEHYSIKDFFIAIEGLDNHRAENKVFRGQKLIKNNTININETVLIGDTTHDFEVAEELGVDCILIANGHQNKNRLTNITSSKLKVYNNLKDLL